MQNARIKIFSLFILFCCICECNKHKRRDFSDEEGVKPSDKNIPVEGYIDGKKGGKVSSNDGNARMEFPAGFGNSRTVRILTTELQRPLGTILLGPSYRIDSNREGDILDRKGWLFT